jgi:hypothetical protein
MESDHIFIHRNQEDSLTVCTSPVKKAGRVKKYLKNAMI